MSDTSRAGAPARLEAVIATKSVRAANGGAIEVLRDLSLTIEAGRLAALIGPSGCGKTTFLKCVAGLDAAFEGRISLPAHARLGVVFQEPRLLPWRTVEANIRLAAPAVDSTVLGRLLTALRLDGHRHHYPGELSLGLARRVAIARAFAVEPDVLLLDEPFVSLDAPLAAELRRELAALLAERPVTTLLVTHDAAEAAELADVIYLLSPRPAHVVDTIAVERSRASRSAQDIAELAASLRSRLTVIERVKQPAR